MFNEITQQLINQNEGDIEMELHALGVPIGQKIYELAIYREKAMKNSNNICKYGKRELKIESLLHFVS